MELKDRYLKVRKHTEMICSHLQTEDYVVQPVVDVSPPKWHIGHTTWFFETFILKPYLMGYQEYNPDYNYVFNSYYETVGNRVIRTDRGNLSRPTVIEIYRYREYVDEAMSHFLCEPADNDMKELIILGLNHEEQHQELLYTDIKYSLGHNPLFPAYSDQDLVGNAQPASHPEAGGATTVADGQALEAEQTPFLFIPSGIYTIGYQGNGFCFDNELAPHKVFLNEFRIAAGPVTNQEYLEFMASGGYGNFVWWHAEGWDWVKKNAVTAPLYWHLIDGQWQEYTLSGLQPVDPRQPVGHISYYEATAYAAWKGC